MANRRELARTLILLNGWGGEHGAAGAADRWARPAVSLHAIRPADQRPAFCCATMQNSIGIESMVFTRDVRPAMRAALAFSSAAASTMPSAFCWFGQLMNQTL